MAYEDKGPGPKLWTMNPAQILRDAAKLIEAGWCQGDYFIDDRCCMIGAIVKAAHPDVDICDIPTSHVEERFRGVLTEVTREEYPHLWNDNPSRTKEAALLRAADMVEADGVEP